MNETVLFVDDDSNLLQGLQRMLRSKRKDWEMTFVSGPRQALEQMEKRCFDVIVTDMRMPEMDGAELLLRVKSICPRSVRIVLSGQAELGTIMKAIGSTHQYLSKPCDAELLKATIDRAAYLRKVMNNEALEEFISGLEHIPAQPDVYDQVIDAVNAEKPSIEKISTVIARDIGMAAKILQLVNSSFFGPKCDVVDIYGAIGSLGVELLRKLIISHGIFTRSETGYVGGVSLELLNRHSISIGNFALRIATLEGIPRTEANVCSLTGLLHDIGKIVLSLYAPEKYKEILAIGNLGQEEEGWSEKEFELFGTTHSEVGAYLLGIWGLPKSVVDAASHHCDACDISQHFTVLSALKIANLLSNATGTPGCDYLERYVEFDSYRKILAGRGRDVKSR